MQPSTGVPRSSEAAAPVQEYLAHKKPPPPLGSPHGPRNMLLGSEGKAVSDERGTSAVIARAASHHKPWEVAPIESVT